MANITIGIDLGTSSVKAMALSETGDIVSQSQQTYPTHRNDNGHIEQSPTDWWQAVVQCCHSIVDETNEHTIIGIGLCGQLNGFVLLDENDNLLQDAIIWLDQRAQPETEDFAHHFGDKFNAITGNGSAAISVLSKLKWMVDNKPEIIQKTNKVMFVKDYITYKMTGTWLTDASDASATNMMDITTYNWNDDLLAYCGISADILPPIMPSNHIAGTVHAQASREMGIAEGTPVVIGAGDVTSLSIGCGVYDDGIAGITLGTAGHVVVASTHPPKINDKNMWRLSHVDTSKEIWLGLIISGGLSLVWAKDVLTALCKDDVSFDDFVAEADGVPIGSHGLCFLPFLEGVAPPHHTPNATGSLHGLRAHHNAGDIINAVMEGVACNIKDCLVEFTKMGADIKSVRIAEGGAQSPKWCQVIANILQIPVVKITQNDTSASGAAIIAMQALKEDISMSAMIDNMVQIEQTYHPEKNTSKQAEHIYKNYQKLIQQLMGNS